MTKINRDYIELRKLIASYIDRYPSANRNTNGIKLERLHNLKLTKDSSKKDEDEYYKLRNELVLSNGGFAMTYVMRYNNLLNDDASISELFQEAIIGIIEAIETFNIDKNTTFTTYAYYHVKKRIIDYIKKNKLIRAPRDIARNIKHVNNVQEILCTTKGIIPTAQDIKDELDKQNICLKIDTINNILILLDLNSSGSDDTFISEYADQVYCEDKESTLFRSLELNILGAIQNESELNQRVIKLRFGVAEEYPHSVEEIKLMLELTDDDIKKI